MRVAVLNALRQGLEKLLSYPPSADGKDVPEV